MKERNKYLEAIWGPFDKESLIDWLIIIIAFGVLVAIIVPAIAGGVI
jgi:hypothetical protein|tara:strand:- start:1097 stop:1237 length:141 start_codon:yes stop_codon:yes gene_type:complete